MGVIQTSKYQALLVSDSSKAQAKRKSKQKDQKTADSKPKSNQQSSKGGSSSKKKKFKNMLCPYCEKGYHLKEHCMRKQFDEMYTLLKQNNIAPPRAKNPDEEASIEDVERCHALKSTLSPSLAYIIDSGASNHMVSSK